MLFEKGLNKANKTKKKKRERKKWLRNLIMDTEGEHQREIKGEDIYEHGHIKRFKYAGLHHTTLYLVKPPYHKLKDFDYAVLKIEDDYYCNCPDFRFNSDSCKHIHAVKAFESTKKK